MLDCIHIMIISIPFLSLLTSLVSWLALLPREWPAENVKTHWESLPQPFYL